MPPSIEKGKAEQLLPWFHQHYLSLGISFCYAGDRRLALLRRHTSQSGIRVSPACGKSNLLEIFFPLPFVHSRVAPSTAPFLDYMVGNEENQGNHWHIPQVLRLPCNLPSLFHLSESSYACLLCYVHVFRKEEGWEEWAYSTFVTNTSASFYQSNFNTLFFKMFSYPVFTLHSNLFESTGLCLFTIHLPRNTNQEETGMDPST